ncbi:SE1832 family protein [Salibacterium lacus]|uniref:SE1832 family protein n=1 Tax=Salibacterium lacus TaxID=1898109 RepID=A0ABW5T5F4_9BACI
MERKEIEEKIQNLKMDYIRIQGDLDKLETVGGNAAGAIRELELIETEMKELNQALQKK